VPDSGRTYSQHGSQVDAKKLTPLLWLLLLLLLLLGQLR
jgi:hypothetical protein